MMGLYFPYRQVEKKFSKKFSISTCFVIIEVIQVDLLELSNYLDIYFLVFC